MNERIKELVEQAGYTEGMYETDDGPWVGPEFNIEKFAELLIKECAKIAELGGDKVTSFAIETNFGVES